MPKNYRSDREASQTTNREKENARGRLTFYFQKLPKLTKSRVFLKDKVSYATIAVGVCTTNERPKSTASMKDPDDILARTLEPDQNWETLGYWDKDNFILSTDDKKIRDINDNQMIFERFLNPLDRRANFNTAKKEIVVKNAILHYDFVCPIKNLMVKDKNSEREEEEEEDETEEKEEEDEIKNKNENEYTLKRQRKEKHKKAKNDESKNNYVIKNMAFIFVYLSQHPTESI